MIGNKIYFLLGRDLGFDSGEEDSDFSMRRNKRSQNKRRIYSSSSEDSSDSERIPSAKRKREDSRNKNTSSSTSKSGESSTGGKNLQKEDESRKLKLSMLAELWPEEERPQSLKGEALADLSMQDMLAFVKLKTDKSKEEADSVDIFQGDKVQPTITWPEQKDNGTTELHPARFSRMPTTSPKEWYHLVPLKRTPILRHLPLYYSGADNMVSIKTVELLQDRTKSLSLKHFHSANLYVTSKTKKEVTKFTADGCTKSFDFNWENPTTLQQLQEAVINYASLLQNIWPYDHTGISLLRLLVKFNWISGAEDFNVRKEVLPTFFANVMSQNCARASNGKAPMSFKAMEDILKDVLLRNGIDASVPLDGYSKKNSKGKDQNNGKQGDRFGQRSTGGNRKPAELNGLQVCFNFNKGQCRNATEKGGCKDGYGRRFAHCCNVYTQGKGHCLKPHCRRDHQY